MKTLLVVFPEQNPFGATWSFYNVWFGMISFVISTGSLKNQDMTRILKQWRHDFSGKHLRDRYCMDIIWCLFGGRISWFCKASLRICYVSLFGSKGPWMLKTYKLPCVWQKITKLDWRSTIYSAVKFFVTHLCLVFSVFDTLC